MARGRSRKRGGGGGRGRRGKVTEELASVERDQVGDVEPPPPPPIPVDLSLVKHERVEDDEEEGVFGSVQGIKEEGGERGSGARLVDILESHLDSTPKPPRNRSSGPPPEPTRKSTRISARQSQRLSSPNRPPSPPPKRQRRPRTKPVTPAPPQLTMMDVKKEPVDSDDEERYDITRVKLEVSTPPHEPDDLSERPAVSAVVTVGGGEKDGAKGKKPLIKPPVLKFNRGVGVGVTVTVEKEGREEVGRVVEGVEEPAESEVIKITSYTPLSSVLREKYYVVDPDKDKAVFEKPLGYMIKSALMGYHDLATEKLPKLTRKMTLQAAHSHALASSISEKHNLQLELLKQNEKYRTDNMKLDLMSEHERKRAEDAWQKLDRTLLHSKTYEEGQAQQHFLGKRFTDAVEGVRGACEKRLKDLEMDRGKLAKENEALVREKEKFQKRLRKVNGRVGELEGVVEELKGVVGGLVGVVMEESGKGKEVEEIAVKVFGEVVRGCVEKGGGGGKEFWERVFGRGKKLDCPFDSAGIQVGSVVEVEGESDDEEEFVEVDEEFGEEGGGDGKGFDERMFSGLGGEDVQLVVENFGGVMEGLDGLFGVIGGGEGGRVESKEQVVGGEGVDHQVVFVDHQGVGSEQEEERVGSGGGDEAFDDGRVEWWLTVVTKEEGEGVAVPVVDEVAGNQGQVTYQVEPEGVGDEMQEIVGVTPVVDQDIVEEMQVGDQESFDGTTDVSGVVFESHVVDEVTQGTAVVDDVGAKDMPIIDDQAKEPRVVDEDVGNETADLNDDRGGKETDNESPVVVEVVAKEISQVSEVVVKETSVVDEHVAEETQVIEQHVANEAVVLNKSEVIDQLPITIDQFIPVPFFKQEVSEQPTVPIEPVVKQPTIQIEPVTKPPTIPIEPVTKQPTIPIEPVTKQAAIPIEPVTKQAAIPIEPVTKPPTIPIEPVTKQQTIPIESVTKPPTIPIEPVVKPPTIPIEPVSKLPTIPIESVTRQPTIESVAKPQTIPIEPVSKLPTIPIESVTRQPTIESVAKPPTIPIEPVTKQPTIPVEPVIKQTEPVTKPPTTPIEPVVKQPTQDPVVTHLHPGVILTTLPDGKILMNGRRGYEPGETISDWGEDPADDMETTPAHDFISRGYKRRKDRKERGRENKMRRLDEPEADQRKVESKPSPFAIQKTTVKPDPVVKPVSIKQEPDTSVRGRLSKNVGEILPVGELGSKCEKRKLEDHVKRVRGEKDEGKVKKVQEVKPCKVVKSGKKIMAELFGDEDVDERERGEEFDFGDGSSSDSVYSDLAKDLDLSSSDEEEVGGGQVVGRGVEDLQSMFEPLVLSPLDQLTEENGPVIPQIISLVKRFDHPAQPFYNMMIESTEDDLNLGMQDGGTVGAPLVPRFRHLFACIVGISRVGGEYSGFWRSFLDYLRAIFKDDRSRDIEDEFLLKHVGRLVGAICLEFKGDREGMACVVDCCLYRGPYCYAFVFGAFCNYSGMLGWSKDVMQFGDLRVESRGLVWYLCKNVKWGDSVVGGNLISFLRGSLGLPVLEDSLVECLNVVVREVRKGVAGGGVAKVVSLVCVGLGVGWFERNFCLMFDGWLKEFGEGGIRGGGFKELVEGMGMAAVAFRRDELPVDLKCVTLRLDVICRMKEMPDEIIVIANDYLGQIGMLKLRDYGDPIDGWGDYAKRAATRETKCFPKKKKNKKRCDGRRGGSSQGAMGGAPVPVQRPGLLPTPGCSPVGGGGGWVRGSNEGMQQRGWRGNRGGWKGGRGEGRGGGRGEGRSSGGRGEARGGGRGEGRGNRGRGRGGRDNRGRGQRGY